MACTTPDEDRRELFGRMVFNAVCGNDGDHVRNHAVCFRPDLGGWRLSPAFDVVPNPVLDDDWAQSVRARLHANLGLLR